MAELPKDMIFHYHSDDGITVKVDAIPLVRCRDCKWCEYPVYNSTKYGCKLFDRCVKGDWFCADGERR